MDMRNWVIKNLNRYIYFIHVNAYVIPSITIEILSNGVLVQRFGRNHI